MVPVELFTLASGVVGRSTDVIDDSRTCREDREEGS